LALLPSHPRLKVHVAPLMFDKCLIWTWIWTWIWQEEKKKGGADSCLLWYNRVRVCLF
jgi:hypothetical protein